MIKAVRVDHRLLHGQVVFKWSKALDIDCILIANDSVAQDSLRMSALRLAKPDHTKLVIKSTGDSIAALTSGITDKYKLFIITETIEDACRLAEATSDLRQINIGGTTLRDDAQQISAAVFVTPKEIERLKQVSEMGCEVVVQMVPEDTPQKFKDLI